jgi:hypothetical protein
LLLLLLLSHVVIAIAKLKKMQSFAQIVDLHKHKLSFVRIVATNFLLKKTFVLNVGLKENRLLYFKCRKFEEGVNFL